MDNKDKLVRDEDFINKAIAVTIRIGFMLFLLVWCYKIISPFIMPVLWGIIIAVSIYPVFKKLVSILGNREKLAATLLTLFALSLLIVPTVFFLESTVTSMQTLGKKIEEGSLAVPPPSEKVASWPVVGKPLHDVWMLASENIGAAIQKFKPQIKKIAPKLLSAAAGLVFTILQFIISIIISGALLVYAQSSERTAQTVFTRLMGEQKKDFTKVAGATIRSVVQGVLGIAFIQAVLAGIGMLAVGVPAAGLLALVVLFFAIVQLPGILVLGPVIVYVFTITDTTPAVIFMIWSLVVGLSDNFLKPLLLARGVDTPMLVILLGAIGGMMTSGIIGLFVGAVVLTLGYTVFTALLEMDSSSPQNSDSVEKLNSDNQ